MLSAYFSLPRFSPSRPGTGSVAGTCEDGRA